MLTKTLFALFLITGGSIVLTNYSQSHYLKISNPSSHQIITQLPLIEVKTIAQKITVQVYSGQDHASGILIAQNNNTYTVITNAHVTDRGKTYVIQTPDGIRHNATMVTQDSSDTGNDLAVLEFNSSHNYQVAKLGNSDSITVGETVIAAGFPHDKKQLLVTEGKISLISKKPLKKGYSLGFSNETVQGMSGGVLLNSEGEVIAVLGKGKDAILDTAYDYIDGSKPTKEELSKLRDVSFSIPIANIAILSTELASLVASENNSNLTQKTTEKSEYTGIVKKVDRIAEKITVRIATAEIPSYGSGVIIARNGNTYYVSTAKHVVKNRGEYQIVTPDGATYNLDNQTIKDSDAYDFAVFSFNSEKNYEIATLGNYTVAGNDEQVVFVSGFPKNKFPQRIITGGKVIKQDKTDFNAKGSDSFLSITSDRPGLLYTNISYGGMSGGAVLDSEGRLVGINAGAENGLYFDEEGNHEEFSLGFSLGVPIQDIFSFLDSETQLNQKWLQTTKNPAVEVTERDYSNIEAQLLIAKPLQDSTSVAEWMNYGNQLWRYKKYDEAINALEKVTQIKPDFDRAYYVMGLVYWYQNNNQQAATTLLKATEVNPNPYFYWRYLGLSYAELEQYDEALSAYEQAISKNPQDFVLYLEQGSVLDKLELYDRALVSYNQAAKINPNHPWIYNNRGLIYKNQGKLDLAFADYNKAIQLNPRLAVVYRNRGVIYYDQEKLDLAFADFNQAILIDPQYATAYNSRGVIYKEQGKLDLAVADYNQAIQINRQNGRKYAPAYNNRGNVYEEQGKLDLAVADYNQAIQIDPNFAKAYRNRGFIYEKQSKLDLAVADYNQVIQIDPQYASAYRNRGLVYHKQRKLDLALADYNQAIQIDPQYASAYYNRGVIYGEQGKIALALADYNQAIKFNSKYVRAYHNRGLIHYQQKQLELALTDFNQAIKLNPKLALAYYNRGNIYRDEEKTELALADYSQAIKLDPKLALAYNNRGVIYLKQKQLELALADYNQATQLDTKLASAYIGLGLTYVQLKNIEAAKTNLQTAQQLYIAQNDTAGAQEIADFLGKLP